MMNYLAHAYLSFNHPQVLVGNMISDFVKGRTRFEYERLVQAGIQLHRDIDSFTDSHAATKEAREIFRPQYRLYSGAIVDVLYDHYLANDAAEFSDESLQRFSATTYAHLEQHTAQLPGRFLFLLPYMRSENWLYNYRFPYGMERSLRGLVRRSAYLSDHRPAFELFDRHYTRLQTLYMDFFKDVKMFAKQRFTHLVL